MRRPGAEVFPCSRYHSQADLYDFVKTATLCRFRFNAEAASKPGMLMLNDVSVLVVDDDPAIRALITTLLNRTHAKVDCVEDGDVAMTRLGSQSYSVIVLDLMLPKVDGFEVLDRVASTQPDLLNRVIVLTAVARTKLAPLERRRVWRVMRKPFDIDDFTNAVAQCAAQPEVKEVSHAT